MSEELLPYLPRAAYTSSSDCKSWRLGAGGAKIHPAFQGSKVSKIRICLFEELFSEASIQELFYQIRFEAATSAVQGSTLRFSYIYMPSCVPLSCLSEYEKSLQETNVLPKKHTISQALK